MLRIAWILFSLSLIFLSSACHLVSQDASLDLDLRKVHGIDVKKKSSVNVKVRDKRENKHVIGSRWQILGGSIENDEDVARMVEKKLLRLFLDNDFSKGNYRTVEVTINSLEYDTKMSFFGMRYLVKSSIFVLVKDRRNHILFSDSFSDSATKTSFFAPTAETNEKLINQVFSSVFARIFDSSGFLNALDN